MPFRARRPWLAPVLSAAFFVSLAADDSVVARAAGSPAHGAGRVIYAFLGGSDGIGPVSQLAVDEAGVLSGTTSYGGGTSCTGGEGGCGTIFSVTPSGSGFSESILYRFEGSVMGPMPSGLISVQNVYYGSAADGGTYNQCDYGIGCGYVYQLAPSSSGYSSTTLHSFNGSDGAFPEAVPLKTNAVMYGTTSGGGVHCQGSGFNGNGCGVIYSMNVDGSSFADLYYFAGGLDGWAPAGPLIMDKSGAIYGTTMLGGGFACGDTGCGTVFKLTPAGSGYTESVLYRFRCCNDGIFPAGSLLPQGSALFGTTVSGGTYNHGTVFKLERAKSAYKETFLYSFHGGKDGLEPNAELVADNSGAVYGTTQYGGGNGCGGTGCGTVFKLARTGSGYSESILYRFEAGARNPSGGLTLFASALYGTTFSGGNISACPPNGCGTVYEITL